MSRPDHIDRPTRVLGWSVVCSLLVHGMLLMAWRPQQADLAFSSQPLALRLVTTQRRTDRSRPAENGRATQAVPAAAPDTTGVEQPATAKQTPLAAATKTAETQSPAYEPPAVTPPEQSPVIAEPDAKPPTVVSEQGQASVSNAYLLASLHTQLSRYFTYPRLARRRGWEGVVILGFVLRPNGRIDTVKVAKSSGFELLDRSARKAMEKVHQLRLSDLKLVSARKLELPVQFRLSE